MELQYLLGSIVLTAVASTTIGYIVIEHYGRKWFDRWIAELDIFQSERETMLREIKVEFLEELINMTRIASDIASRGLESEEKEINEE